MQKVIQQVEDVRENIAETVQGEESVRIRIVVLQGIELVLLTLFVPACSKCCMCAHRRAIELS